MKAVTLIKFITMKSLIVLFSLISISSFAQEPNAAIELKEMNVLYRGYSSKIEVAVSNSVDSNLRLSCANCDTLYRLNSNQYVIKPSKALKTSIRVNLKSGDSTKLIEQIDYKVRAMPDPVLFWGSSKDGNKASKASRLLQAKYTPEIPLQASFRIIKWTITLKEESVSGIGGNLSKAGPLINSATEGDLIIFRVVARGPDGIDRNLAAVYSI